MTVRGGSSWDGLLWLWSLLKMDIKDANTYLLTHYKELAFNTTNGTSNPESLCSARCATRESVGRKKRVTRGSMPGLCAAPLSVVPPHKGGAAQDKFHVPRPLSATQSGLAALGIRGLGGAASAVGALSESVWQRRSWNNPCFRQKSRGAAGQVPPLLSFAALAR